MNPNLKNNGDVIIYQSEDGATKINVNLQDETVWLSQQQLVELYHASKSNISEHIKHIFAEGELDKESVVRNFRITEDSCNSPSSNICFICSLIFDLLA